MEYDDCPWIYQGFAVDEEELDNFAGFIYLITNTLNKRKYIGKKLFKFKRKKVLKGKVKRFLIDSDWKTYFSSSETLKKDVEEQGYQNFKREILRLCKTKSEMSYYESKHIFETNALLRPDFYNDWISCR